MFTQITPTSISNPLKHFKEPKFSDFLLSACCHFFWNIASQIQRLKKKKDHLKREKKLQSVADKAA